MAEKRVERVPPSAEELDGLRELLARNLNDARLSGLSADGRFAMAYNAARLLSTIAIRAAGYRVRGHAGAHYGTFVALEAAMGSSVSDIAGYFDTCRRKRNELSYDTAGIASDGEAAELLEKATAFSALVEDWLRRNHPALSKPRR